MLRSSRRSEAYSRKSFLEKMTPDFSSESPACASVAPGGTTTRTARPGDPALHDTTNVSSSAQRVGRRLEAMSICISRRQAERVLQQYRGGESIHVSLARARDAATPVGHFVDGAQRL